MNIVNNKMGKSVEKVWLKIMRFIRFFFIDQKRFGSLFGIVICEWGVGQIEKEYWEIVGQKYSWEVKVSI